ncbi:MAG: serine/threonine protein kinase [Ottowia sp.]|nr:MAG: serine/threonine protein kinase [Ottowia sp.]
MTTRDDPALEARALHLFRDLLDMQADARAQALATLDPALQARVRTLLDCMAEDDLHADAAAAIAGQRLGAYALIERIGQGGMGEVYRAERVDGAFELEVAIKRIFGGHAPLAARFVRERQVLAKLQHPHIAQLLDGGIDAQGYPWLAMELVLGDEILRWCDTRQAPLTRRVELLRELCEAVDYAHRNLIVHRDIKPSNVLVDADGRTKLLDFGIARLLDEGERERTQTLAMTPAWATPEQQRGEAATTSSDIYQIGLLARALLTGLPRGEPGARMSVDLARLQREHPAQATSQAQVRGCADAEALRRALRGDLDSIVALATAIDPDQRYPSARALADDFKLWLRGQPVQARADERGYRLRRTARRWWPALAAGVVGLTFLGYHMHSLQAALARTEAQRARAQLAEQVARGAQTQAEQQRNTAKAVSDYFIKMFSMLGPEAIQGKTPATVQQLLESGANGLDDVAAQKERDPEALAAMWSALSTVHVNLGEHAQALVLADKAVQSASVAEDRQTTAEALRARSNAQQWLGRSDDAFATTLQAVAVLGEDRGQYGTLPAKLHDDLSWAYKERGDYAKAMQQARLSIAGLRRDAQAVRRLGFVQALNNGGDTAINAGDLAQARTWLEEGARRYPQLANPNPSTWILLQANLANLALDEDRVAVARQQLLALLPQSRAQFGDAHPRTDLVLTYLARATLAGDDRQAAVDAARQLLASSTATYGAGHPAVEDARGVLLVALLLAREEHEAAVVRAQLQPRCIEQAVDANGQLLKAACARSDRDMVALADGSSVLAGFRDVMPWQKRIVERWRVELTSAAGGADERAKHATTRR